MTSPGNVRVAALVVVAALGSAGCRQDMHNTPRVEPYEATDAFEDGQGNRPIVEGTVARGQLNADTLLHTGKIDGQFVDLFPFPVTREVLDRGRGQFTTYCTPCHGQTGLGNGMIVQRGLRPPPSFHEEKIRTQQVGYYFDVMTNGFGAMLDYRAQVSVEDRWAIAAYIRALQYSQRAPLSDVPADRRHELDAPLTPEQPAAAPSHGAAEH